MIVLRAKPANYQLAHRLLARGLGIPVALDPGVDRVELVGPELDRE